MDSEETSSDEYVIPSKNKAKFAQKRLNAKSKVISKSVKLTKPVPNKGIKLSNKTKVSSAVYVFSVWYRVCRKCTCSYVYQFNRSCICGW